MRRHYYSAHTLLPLFTPKPPRAPHIGATRLARRVVGTLGRRRDVGARSARSQPQCLL